MIPAKKRDPLECSKISGTNTETDSIFRVKQIRNKIYQLSKTKSIEVTREQIFKTEHIEFFNQLLEKNPGMKPKEAVLLFEEQFGIQQEIPEYLKKNSAKFSYLKSKKRKP
jgi:hypothetical protein